MSLKTSCRASGSPSPSGQRAALPNLNPCWCFHQQAAYIRTGRESCWSQDQQGFKNNPLCFCAFVATFPLSSGWCPHLPASRIPELHVGFPSVGVGLCYSAVGLSVGEDTNRGMGNISLKLLSRSFKSLQSRLGSIYFAVFRPPCRNLIIAMITCPEDSCFPLVGRRKSSSCYGSKSRFAKDLKQRGESNSHVLQMRASA